MRASYEADLGGVGAFLPARVPLDWLPVPLSRFLEACDELPARYPKGRGGVRAWLDNEFGSDDPEVIKAVGRLEGGRADTLMTALCTLGHTYRWDEAPPAPERFDERRIPIPAGIANPWRLLARRLDQPTVGSAWSLHLTNWTMVDRPGGSPYDPAELTPSSLRVARNWLEPPLAMQLESFSLAFVLMEAQGAPVLRAVVETVAAMADDHVGDAIAALRRLHDATRAMTLGFSRHVHKRSVDPAVWLEQIQPTFAWGAYADGSARIEGGPSGMQVGTIQALDATLGIERCSALAPLAIAARRHMPVAHRRFLATLDRVGPILRAFVRDRGSVELTEQFDACVGALAGFRVTHWARGATYLRNRPAGDAVRASTGLTIGVDDNPVATFERTMNERIAETRAGAFAAAPARAAGDL